MTLPPAAEGSSNTCQRIAPPWPVNFTREAGRLRACLHGRHIDFHGFSPARRSLRPIGTAEFALPVGISAASPACQREGRYHQRDSRYQQQHKRDLTKSSLVEVSVK